MVLPGADRESAGSASQTSFDPDERVDQDAAASTHDNFSPRSIRNSSTTTAEEERFKQLATVDLKHADLSTLRAKQRSLVAYFNPAYDRWFALKIGLAVVKAQVRIERVLTPSEVAHYTEAVVDANNEGILYKRALLWPTAAVIMAASRGRAVISAPTLSRRILFNIFNIRSPTSQFILAWFVADSVDGYVASTALETKLRTTPALQDLHTDIRNASMTRAQRGKAMSSKGDQTQSSPDDNYEHIAKDHPSDDDNSMTDRQWTSSEQPDPSSSTEGHQPSDGRYVNDHVPPLAQDQVPASEPVTGAWDRLRQRSEANRQNEPQQNSVGSWQQRRAAAFGSDTSYSVAASDRGFSQDNARGHDTDDRSDIWDRRRTAEADEYADTRGGINSAGHYSGSLGDRFAFSNDDAERELAKSEAQEDFDRRIERERNGEDFDSSASALRRSNR